MKKITYFLSFINGLICGILAFFVLRYFHLKEGFVLPLIGDRFFLLLFACILFPLALFIANFLFQKIKSLLQLVKFLEVGVLNTLIDNGILNFLMWKTGIEKGGFYLIFIGIAFTIATVNSYCWNKFWTFEKTETRAVPKEFGAFYIVTVISLLIREAIAHGVVNIMGPQFGLSPLLWANVGWGIGILCAFMWNFLGYKFLIFKK